VQPGGRDDVGAALLFEEEGEPEGEFGAVGRAQGGGFALEIGRVSSVVRERGGTGWGEENVRRAGRCARGAGAA